LLHSYSQAAAGLLCSGAGRILIVNWGEAVEVIPMPYRNSWRFAVTLILAGSVCPCARVARSQDSQSQDQDAQSVADAARRARQEKAAAKSAKKVITDDDLPASNFKPGAEGVDIGSAPKSDSEPPNPAAVAADVAKDDAAVSVDKAAIKKGKSPEIAALEEKLALAQKELDLLQRELALDQDTYFSQVDYAHDTAGKAKLDAEKQHINDKQQTIEGLKTRLAALKELEEHKKAEAAVAATSTEHDKPAPPPAPPQ
jgi:hypothetical protein